MAVQDDSHFEKYRDVTRAFLLQITEYEKFDHPINQANSPYIVPLFGKSFEELLCYGLVLGNLTTPAPPKGGIDLVLFEDELQKRISKAMAALFNKRRLLYSASLSEEITLYRIAWLYHEYELDQTLGELRAEGKYKKAKRAAAISSVLERYHAATKAHLTGGPTLERRYKTLCENHLDDLLNIIRNGGADADGWSQRLHLQKLRDIDHALQNSGIQFNIDRLLRKEFHGLVSATE